MSAMRILSLVTMAVGAAAVSGPPLHAPETYEGLVQKQHSLMQKMQTLSTDGVPVDQQTCFAAFEDFPAQPMVMTFTDALSQSG